MNRPCLWTSVNLTSKKKLLLNCYFNVAETHGYYGQNYRKWSTAPRILNLGPKWVRLTQIGTNLGLLQIWFEFIWLQSGSDWTPNWTNPGLFQIRFQYIWLDEPNVLNSDLKKSRICPISGPIWPTLEPNLPSLSGRLFVSWVFPLRFQLRVLHIEIQVLLGEYPRNILFCSISRQPNIDRVRISPCNLF